jgi:hypothetical protein
LDIDEEIKELSVLFLDVLEDDEDEVDDDVDGKSFPHFSQ